MALLKRRRNSFGFWEWIIFIVLLAGVVLVAYPLFWMMMSSLKTTSEIQLQVWSLPKKPMWGNYSTAWRRGISGYFVNSIIVTFATIAGVTAIASLCAYGLARFKAPWLKYVLILVMGGMMLNPQVCLIPLYSLLRKLKMHNTYFALIVPYIAFRLPLITLLIRTFFLATPREIEESATLDGCNDFQTYSRIFMPMAQSILVTGVILTAFYAWNEFLFGIIFIDSSRYRTIPAGLMSFRDTLRTDWGLLLAGMGFSAMPMILLFVALQKYFIRGMLAGSVKG